MPLRVTDLPEPVVPATIMCGIFARSAMTGAPSMSRERSIGSAIFCTAAFHSGDSAMPRSGTGRDLMLGTSRPTTSLPGMGAMMRRLFARRFICRLLWTLWMRSTLTPLSGFTS